MNKLCRRVKNVFIPTMYSASNSLKIHILFKGKINGTDIVHTTWYGNTRCSKLYEIKRFQD